MFKIKIRQNRFSALQKSMTNVTYKNSILTNGLVIVKLRPIYNEKYYSCFIQGFNQKLKIFFEYMYIFIIRSIKIIKSDYKIYYSILVKYSLKHNI